MQGRRADDVAAEWAADGLSAFLHASDGSWMAHLRVEQWYQDQQLEPAFAWVASWLDPDAASPMMLSAAVELPALSADDSERRDLLVALALEAIEHSPETPAPFAAPAPTPRTADEWAEHLDLQLASWELAYGELADACKDMGPAAELARYRALTQALDWTYAMDSSLGLLWKSLPHAVQEEASLETDERARRAAEHNAAGPLRFDLQTDYAFVGYVRRLQDHRPYTHWGELMLSGVFQGAFFHAVSWVRGQLIHAATSAPMDLRQFRPGAEPRWKWRESALFARGRADDAGRRAYDQILARHDVLGLLGHLRSAFFETAMQLRRRLRSTE